jgi:tetratricopeptide (TPR) repeat protein
VDNLAGDPPPGPVFEIKTVEASMAIEPQDLDVEESLALARHQVQHGDFESALARLKPLAALAQPPADSLALMARVYAQLGLMERAQGAFRRYLESHPGAAHETFELGATYFDEGNDAMALEHWTRALAIAPTHPPALFFSAAALSRSGKAADARRHLEVLFNSAPADNLYMERARDLLKTLDAATAPVITGAPQPVTPYGGH